MKDEEMAEEYAEEYRKTFRYYRTWNGQVVDKSPSTIVEQSFKDGFLAGLKAGRPQWHDLRKDPNDLPKVKKGTSCTPVIILDSNKYFSVAHYCKGTIAGAFMIDGRQWETIAWCEIPTFDKE